MKNHKCGSNVSLQEGTRMLWVVGVYHTQFSVAYNNFLVSALLSKMFDVRDRDLPVMTSSS